MARPNVEVERRQQILLSTCQVIAHQGVKALRMADIAQVAGLSTGIIHYYFDNKKDLIRAAFQKNFECSLQNRVDISNSDRTPLEKLHAHIDATLPTDKDSIRSWHVWMELWSASLHDDGLQKLNDRAYTERRQIVTQVVENCRHNGSLNIQDPTETADMLMALLDGLALQVLAQSSAMDTQHMRATGHAFIKHFRQSQRIA